MGGEGKHNEKNCCRYHRRSIIFASTFALIYSGFSRTGIHTLFLLTHSGTSGILCLHIAMPLHFEFLLDYVWQRRTST